MHNRVGVLLASYNGEHYIREQLLSIINQENVSLHVFVSDDGSTDATREIVDVLSSNCSEITLLPVGQPTGSPAGNFFRLLSVIDLSNFSHIAFADQDDIWSLNKIERALMQMKVNDADGYSSDLISYSIETRKVKYILKSHAQRDYDYIFQGASAGCTYVISARLAAQIKNRISSIPFSEFKNRSHDWLIYAMARAAEYRWFCDPKSFVFYRQHSSNVYGAHSSLSGILSKIDKIKNGWYRENIIWLGSFVNKNEVLSDIFRRVERWSWIDRCYVAIHSNKFRRRRRDILVLFFFALLGIMN